VASTCFYGHFLVIGEWFLIIGEWFLIVVNMALLAVNDNGRVEQGVGCVLLGFSLHSVLINPQGYFGAKPLNTTPSKKRTYDYFLTSIFLDLSV
jgi:hypothetical protein